MSAVRVATRSGSQSISVSRLVRSAAASTPCMSAFPTPERWCGGCEWQHLSHDAQLEAKRAIVAECVERIWRK